MKSDGFTQLDSEQSEVKAEAARGAAWFETALIITFAAATVLFASFVAVITGLV